MEDAGPLLKRSVARHDYSLSFVCLVDDLKEMVRGSLVQAQKPQFVDDEQVELRVALKFPFMKLLSSKEA
jgi:hypothetical protein